MGRRKRTDNEKLAREGFWKKGIIKKREGKRLDIWTPPDPVGFRYSDRDPHRITEVAIVFRSKGTCLHFYSSLSIFFRNKH